MIQEQAVQLDQNLAMDANIIPFFVAHFNKLKHDKLSHLLPIFWLKVFNVLIPIAIF